MAAACLIVVVCALVAVTAAPVNHDRPIFADESSSLATRTLLAAAVFDGRVMAPIHGRRLLFRVRKVYKGWHDGGGVDIDVRHVTRLSNSASRLIFVSCGSTEFAESAPRLGSRSDGCRLSSAVVGQRYLVFAESFHAVVVRVAGGDRRQPAPSTAVGIYRTSGPLVPVTVLARRIARLYSNLGFGQYPFFFIFSPSVNSFTR